MKTIIIFTFIFLINLSAFSQTIGEATYYHSWFENKVMYNGEVYRGYRKTCASMRHKMGTKLKITNLLNKKSVIVVVTDRGDFSHRNVDLSRSAFKQISPLSKGRIRVKIEILK